MRLLLRRRYSLRFMVFISSYHIYPLPPEKTARHMSAPMITSTSPPPISQSPPPPSPPPPSTRPSSPPNPSSPSPPPWHTTPIPSSPAPLVPSTRVPHRPNPSYTLSARLRTPPAADDLTLAVSLGVRGATRAWRGARRLRGCGGLTRRVGFARGFGW